MNFIDVLAQKFSSPPMNVFLLVKFDDKNYMIWKDQLLIFVMVYELEGIVDGSLVPPSMFLVGSMLLNHYLLELEYVEFNS